jgi:hypothetical protein
MKKITISLICALACCAGTYAQGSEHISGEYTFSQAVITANDFYSKTRVFTRTFTDSVQVMTKEWDSPLQPVFSTAIIHNGRVVECTLFIREGLYGITDEGFLVNRTEERPADGNDAFVHERIPFYTIAEEGNTVRITFGKTVYGSSNYPNQTLEGVCEVIMVKQ